VTLEVQPERPPVAHLLDLLREIGGELRILLLDLAQEVAQPRHDGLPASEAPSATRRPSPTSSPRKPVPTFPDTFSIL